MKTESGNALWFVLLAIALLAALTVTIARTSDTTEQNSDIERERIRASDVLRYSSGIESVIAQMRLRGVSEGDISFQNSITTADYTHTVATKCVAPRMDCRVFHAEGGGATYSVPATGVNTGDWIFSGANAVPSVGTAAPELMMILPDVSAAACERINTELGIAGGVTQDTGASDIGTIFTGAFENPGEIIESYPGKKAGCYQGDDDEDANDISDKNYFYQVLIAR